MFNIPIFFKNIRVTEEEFDLKFRDKLFNPNNKYFVGYWQSENYFNSIEKIIREHFKFKPTLSEKNLRLKKRIENSNSVSLHIRRGDYVNNASAYKTHGLCSIEYYNRAIDEIKRQVKDPIFFIFSDDPEWVKSTDFGIINFEIIDWNIGNLSYIDMQMMNCCKHNIIANSSFSWWGAWLNSNSKKIVISPKKWFANDVLNEQAKNIVPNSWIKI